MEPDKDLKEHALEFSPENPAPAPAQAAHSGPENEGAEEKIDVATAEAPAADSPRLSLSRRILEAVEWPLSHLKKTLRIGVLWIINAGKAVTQRFGKRAAPPDEKDGAEERRSDKETRVAKKKPEPPPVDGATVAPRSRLRSFLLTLLVLILGGIAGMTFSFALLSKMIANQAERIGAQRDEMAEMENQLVRLQESEAKYRRENMEHQKKQKNAENQLHPTPQNPGNAPPVVPPAPAAAAAASKPPLPAKSGNCTLESSKIGDNLTRCIDEFNRK